MSSLLDLTRSAPDAARRVVTVSPDVASSTNLGGWLDKVGMWSARERRDWFDDDTETILHWRERPSGQHIELGIAETNLVGLLGELGATWSRWGEPLLPIGVLYDPFVARALEPWAFGRRAGRRPTSGSRPPRVDQALAAADRLSALGTQADVVVVTSPDLLLRAQRAQRARRADTGDPTWILDAVLPAERSAPMVTVLDGHPHTLAFLAGIHGVRGTHLGVTGFGQSSDLAAAYALHGIDADAIVAAALP